MSTDEIKQLISEAIPVLKGFCEKEQLFELNYESGAVGLLKWLIEFRDKKDPPPIDEDDYGAVISNLDGEISTYPIKIEVERFCVDESVLISIKLIKYGGRQSNGPEISLDAVNTLRLIKSLLKEA